MAPSTAMATIPIIGSHRFPNRVHLEVIDRTSHVIQQQCAQVTTDTVANEDPLDHEILLIRRQGIRGNLPATRSEAIRKVIETKAGVASFAHLPT